MEYAGTELELFAAALKWKAYLAAQIQPFVTGRVLEVGAGIGSNITLFHNDRVAAWLALEPDPRLASQIEARCASGEMPPGCAARAGTLADIPADAVFDTIVYIDVLEHITDDRAEVKRAAGHLAPGGNLVILAPAHQYLFSPFDAAIGHFRRYDVAGLAALMPAGCRVVRTRMLDSAGFFLSFANRWVMRSAMPTPAQIALWDRVFVPISRLLDPITGFRFGKSILLVWRRDRAP